MRPQALVLFDVDATEEISALIESLHRTGQRLEELTGGEVDAVADERGKSFLLQRAQEHLRQREADRQEAIINALPASVALLDTNGVIVSVNEAWRDFGAANALHAPGHSVGQDYCAICERATGEDEAAAHEVATGLRSVLRGETRSFCVEYPCHSPTERRWFLMKTTPLESGGAIVMHVEVSAQRLSEEAMRSSELRFRQMAESIRDVFFLLEVDGGRMLYVSPAYEAISGSSCEAVYAHPRAWYEAMHPEDRAAALAAGTRGLSLGEEYGYECRFVRADGSIRWMSVRGFPVHENSGRVVRMAGVAMDVTDRRRSKEELEDTHSRLLEASRRAGMAEVATNMLHNVGNVLNSVNVSASLVLEKVRCSRVSSLEKVVELLREHASDLGGYLTTDPRGRHIPDMLGQIASEWSEQQRSLIGELGALRASIDHIKRIVEIQQDYAKVSGAAEIADIRELVDESLRMDADDLVASGVLIVRHFDEILPIRVEKHKALQILVNLVRNARQSCALSPVDRRRITIGVLETDGRIRISIADTGAGIAPENHVKIFAYGFTTRSEGHGFGLHSGALAATELGGSLVARSDGPGMGATFTLELPADRLEVAHA